jgi:hypothetical protein
VTTASVVWLTQRAVLRRAGYSGRRFLSACLSQYDFYLKPARLPLAPDAGRISAGRSSAGP